MGLKYKLNEAGDAILMSDKGHPIVVDEDKEEDDKNREFGLDAIHLYGKVPELNSESKARKEELRKLSSKLEILKETAEDLDLEDDESVKAWINNAVKAMKTVKNLDEKKLIEAGEVDTIKKQAQETLKEKLDETEKKYRAKLEEKDSEVSSLNQAIIDLMVTDRFNQSEYVKKKLGMTPKMARKYFGDSFKVEQGENGQRRIVAYKPDGEKVYSKEKVGELANFDEALSILVDLDPDKESLLAAAVASGTGLGVQGGGTRRPKVNPFAKDSINLTEQARLFKENPDLAARLQAEAKGQ